MRKRLLAVGAALALVATALVTGITSTASARVDFTNTEPIRAAFFTATYPQQNSWQTNFTPKLGNYDQANSTILASQVALAKSVGLDAFIAPWDGPTSASAARFSPGLINASQSQDFAAAPWYVPENRTTPPTTAELAADFDTLFSLSEDEPNWLRRDGKPVMFVYNGGGQANCAEIDRIATANAGRFHVNLKVFTGYASCPTQPNSWYQYAPATGYSVHGTHSAVVSPGYHKFGDASPLLARDIQRFTTDLQKQVASNAKWQLITTWNNWFEGSSIEPATQWDSSGGLGQYADAVRQAYVVNPNASPPPTSTPPPPAAGDKVIWAVGDNCDDDATSTSTTAGEGCKHVGDMIKADGSTEKVLVLGDSQYENGEAANYSAFYDVGMGKQQIFAGSTQSIFDRTLLAIGNHEYNTTNATPAYTYFGTAHSGDPAKGYYMTDIGAWRLISTNSNCSKAGPTPAGCGPTSSQGIWLADQLQQATAAGDHTIVFFHHPPYSDGANYYPGTTSGKPLWDLAYDNGADIVLTGHDHQFQEWGPISKTVSDTAASPNNAGPHFFIVGTGGKGNTGFCSATTTPSCPAGTNRTLYRWGGGGTDPGALRMVLKADGTSSWQFKTTGGVVQRSGVTDSR